MQETHISNWDDLRIFLGLARAQRVATAARALGVDATTVTRRMARLSAVSGAALFEVVGGVRQLSEAGKALLTQAETIEAALLTATDRLGAIDTGGQVRLSLAEGLATHVVAAAAASLNMAHPRLRLDLVTASGFLDPSRREADIAVMLARPRSKSLVADKLTDYELGLYANDDYLARAGTPTTVADLDNHTLIGYVLEHIHAPELDYLPDIHHGLTARLRSTSINVQQQMISGGAGIGVLPKFIARNDVSLTSVLTEKVKLSRTFWLVTHRETHQNQRVDIVREWLKSLSIIIS